MAERICIKCHKPFDEPHEFKACDSCRTRHRKVCQEWRKRNPEADSNYYNKNKERHYNCLKKWRKNNHEKVNEIGRRSKKLYPEMRRIHEHNRRARMKGNGGAFTLDELNELFEKQEGFCVYCGELLYSSFDKQIHIEHRIPISRGGSNSIENIALSCANCNYRKFTKTDKEFFEELKNGKQSIS